MPNELIVQTVILPFAATLVLFWLCRGALMLTGIEFPTLPSAAVAITFLIAYLVILGLPPWPARASTQKLGYIGLIGLLLGLILDALRGKIPPLVLRILAILLPAGIVVWIGWNKIMARDVQAMLALAALWLCGALAIGRLLELEITAERRLAPGILLLSGSLGAGAMGFYFASASIAQLSGALSVALAAYLLWNWGAQVYRADGAMPFGLGALLGCASALFAIVCILALFTQTNPLVLAAMLPVFFAHLVLGDRPSGTGPVARTLRPIFLFIVSLVPAYLVAATVFSLAILTQSQG